MKGVIFVKSFCIFISALEYIEKNLCEEISQQDIADACCCSLSSLQKMWKYCTKMSIKEYISKRRLASCAKEILSGNGTVTDIAFRYQYNSPEVFTRAFTRMWGETPTKFRNNRKNADFFPRIISADRVSGGIDMRRKVDLSDFYDFLRERKDGYILCFDIVQLSIINEKYGSKCGDAVILEAFRRIDEISGENMAVFRIGGDEFALITGIPDKENVKDTADKILSKNGTAVSCDDIEIPVALRAGAVKYNAGNYRYNELFTTLQNTIDMARNDGNIIFIN